MRSLYELAIDQPVLDMPEVLWKAYIDFEISEVREALQSTLQNVDFLYRKKSKAWCGGDECCISAVLHKLHRLTRRYQLLYQSV